MKTVIITGATGYIGSKLAKKLLNEGFNIGVIKREESKLDKLLGCDVKFFNYDGSIESLKHAMDILRPDTIFHLASTFIARHKAEDIENLILSNILFGTQLLEAMQLSKINKIINTSTAWQTAGGLSYNPFSLYASTKQAFEDILKFYTNTYDIKAISLYLPDSYGADDTRPKILNFIKKAAESKEKLKMSKGEQEMDLLYIDDIVDGFIKGSELIEEEAQKFNIYYLSSRNPTQLRKIVEMYEAINNTSINIEWGALPYRSNEIMKIIVPENILPKWQSKISLEEGLRKFKG